MGDDNDFVPELYRDESAQMDDPGSRINSGRRGRFIPENGPAPAMSGFDQNARNSSGFGPERNTDFRGFGTGRQENVQQVNQIDTEEKHRRTLKNREVVGMTTHCDKIMRVDFLI